MVLTNEQGKEVVSAEAGKPEDWRQEILTTVIFNAVGRQTKVSLYQTVVEEEARKTGAYQSWINMFERLNKIIAG